MKRFFLLAFLSLIFFASGSAQTIEQLKLATDDLVGRVEKSFENSKNKFTLRQKSKKGGFLNETFSYVMNDRSVEAVGVHSQLKDWEYEEFYYFKNEQLIYATEREFIIQDGAKRVVWSGVFYFANGKLLDYTTNGHGKSETDEWEPETAVLSSSRKRLDRLNKYLAQKKS